MRTSIRAVLAGAFLATGASLFAGPAAAQNFPRVTCTGGDNCMVDYGPMGQGAVVGGGRIMVTRMDGMNFDFVHLDMQFSQTAREGFVPLQIGSGESQEIVWVPRAMIEMMRAARTRMTPR